MTLDERHVQAPGNPTATPVPRIDVVARFGRHGPTQRRTPVPDVEDLRVAPNLCDLRGRDRDRPVARLALGLFAVAADDHDETLPRPAHLAPYQQTSAH